MTRDRRFLIVITYISIGMLGIYIAFYQYTILSIANLFLLNAAVMGLLIGIQHTGMILPPLFLGVLSGKIGKKRVAMISYLLLFSGTLLAGVTTGFPFFVVSVVIIGAGYSVAEATLSAVLADEFKDKSSRHLSFSQVVFSIGALAGPFLAQALIKAGVYFKDLYTYCAIIFLLLGTGFFFTKHVNEITLEQSSEPFRKHFFRFFRSRITLLLAAGIFCYMGLENTIASFSDTYFEVMLSAPELSATALALFWGLMIPSRFLGGLVRTRQRQVFIVLSVSLIVFLTAGMLVDDHILKIVFFALSGFACGPLWPFLMDAVKSKDNGSSGPAFNIMFSLGAVGGALLPMTGGQLANAFPVSSVYYFCAAAALVMLFVYFKAKN